MFFGRIVLKIMLLYFLKRMLNHKFTYIKWETVKLYKYKNISVDKNIVMLLRHDFLYTSFLFCVLFFHAILSSNINITIAVLVVKFMDHINHMNTSRDNIINNYTYKNQY